MTDITPQFQTVFTDRERGTFTNCYQVAVAMVLGVNCERIPHFYETFLEHEEEALESKISQWFSRNGLIRVTHTTNASLLGAKDALSQFSNLNPGIPFIFGAEANRGALSAMVARDGEIICDPANRDRVDLDSNLEHEVYYAEFILGKLPTRTYTETL